ncbi:hypothetical protein M5689_024266 [Euphorbia peplus]|nr:hypothetical protein M5689_024266 [Euphorbia peplus]
METAVRYGHPILIRSTRHRLPRNSPFKICCASDLRLSRFQLCNFFCNSQNHMSDLNNLTPLPDKMNKEQQKETKLPPPPPEKPEPGDCCGSGCVSCVWDVYYEQLEAYNNLYKSDSDLPDSKLS